MMRNLLFSSRISRACIWGDEVEWGLHERRCIVLELHSAKPTVPSAASVYKWTNCPNWAPFLGSGADAWREAVMQGSWFYSFLRSPYITDLLCNRTVGGSRKLARTLDKKLNYSRGHVEWGRLGDGEEWAGLPTRHSIWAEKFPICKPHESLISWASVFGEHWKPLAFPLKAPCFLLVKSKTWPSCNRGTKWQFSRRRRRRREAG